MLKMLNSLQTKLTLSFIFLILIISGMTFFFTFGETKKALKETMRDELSAIASVAASQIDGDELSGIKPGDEKTKQFIKLRDDLYAIQKAHKDIKYVYTYQANDDKSVKFIVDATYGMPGAEGAESAAIGEIYKDITPEMIAGLTKSSVENSFSKDKWGSFMSGYAPVLNSKGIAVGSVGIDMLSEKVQQKLNYIGGTIYLVIGIGILFAVLIILFFSATIIRDIKRLNQIAEHVSTGQIDEDVSIKRRDEIGELADSFQRMIMSLRIMRMYPEDKKDK